MAWHKQANETPLVINQENPLTETNSTEMSLSPEVRQTTKQTYTHQVRSRRRCKVRRGKKKNVRRQAKQIGNMIIIIIIKLTIAVPRPNRDGVERAFAFCSASNRSFKICFASNRISVYRIFFFFFFFFFFSSTSSQTHRIRNGEQNSRGAQGKSRSRKLSHKLGKRQQGNGQ
jgi:hypothetical protein